MPSARSVALPQLVGYYTGLTCRNRRTALQLTASHPFSKVRACLAKSTVIQGCLPRLVPLREADP